MLPSYVGKNAKFKTLKVSTSKRYRRTPIPPAVLLLFCLIGSLFLLNRLLQREKQQPTPNSGGRYRRELVTKVDFPAPHLRTLVLVACHSVYTGLDYAHPDAGSSWFLLDYQKGLPGQAHSFVQHIQLGIEMAASDPEAALIFSGGKTRKDAGPRAEGLGYWMVADAAQWYGYQEVRERAYTEEHARDSYENLLFGICRFYELTGSMPVHITVIGYDFKEPRFAEIHRAAVRFPETRFGYVGTPALDPEAARNGEAITLVQWRQDLYGCSLALTEKRKDRDPFNWGGMPGDRCPPLAPLLEYCGPDLFPDEHLPWF